MKNLTEFHNGFFFKCCSSLYYSSIHHVLGAINLTDSKFQVNKWSISLLLGQSFCKTSLIHWNNDEESHEKLPDRKTNEILSSSWFEYFESLKTNRKVISLFLLQYKAVHNWRSVHYGQLCLKENKKQWFVILVCDYILTKVK